MSRYNRYTRYILSVQEVVDDEGNTAYEVYDTNTGYVYDTFDDEWEAWDWCRDEEDYLNHGERV